MNTCKHCGANTTNPTYCNSSCAAKYNNAHRAPRSAESKAKTAVALKGRSSPRKGLGGNGLVCKVSFCIVCSSLIKMTHRKTCSQACYRKNLSIAQSNRLKQAHAENTDKFKRYRGKRSYMEESFSHWLNSINSVPFVEEKKVLNPDTGRYIYMDFFFPDLNLCIELDGTQHEKQKDVDAKRDQFLLSSGVYVFRISASEYKRKTKLDIVQLMVGTAGRNRTHI